MRLTRLTLLLIALIIGLGFFRLVQLLLRDVEAQTFQATEEVLVDTANLLAAMPLDLEEIQLGLERSRKRELEARIYTLNKRGIGIGVYVTNARGVVLFDSEGGRRVGEDFSQRNDVLLTLLGSYGARSTRTDPEDPQSSVLYVAAPLVDENGVVSGVLTVFKAKADVFGFVQERRKSILWTASLIGTGVIALVAATFWWLFRPIGRLTDYARSISSGGRPAPPELGFGREVNTLGKALRDMRESLEGRHYAERYVQNLTHELKSPLAAIKGASELMEEGMPEEDRQRFLTNIQNECDRSEQVIRQLLKLAALEGKTHLEQVEKVDLGELVREVAAECAPRADQRGIRIEAKGACRVMGDRQLLRSAIENLVENAIDFSPDRGEVSVAVIDGEGNKKGLVGVRVTDEGEGFPEFALGRVFERFYSLGRPGSNRKGSGLGLSLVRETAELHGGRTEAENRHGDDTSGGEVTLWIAGGMKGSDEGAVSSSSAGKG